MRMPQMGQMRAHMQAHTCACADAPMYTCMHIQTHAYMHTHTGAYMHAHAHTRAPAYPPEVTGASQGPPTPSSPRKAPGTPRQTRTPAQQEKGRCPGWGINPWCPAKRASMSLHPGSLACTSVPICTRAGQHGGDQAAAAARWMELQPPSWGWGLLRPRQLGGGAREPRVQLQPLPAGQAPASPVCPSSQGWLPAHHLQLTQPPPPSQLGGLGLHPAQHGAPPATTWLQLRGLCCPPGLQGAAGTGSPGPGSSAPSGG